MVARWLEANFYIVGVWPFGLEGLWARYATLQGLIPSFPWIAPPCPPPWSNPRKGKDQILPSGNLLCRTPLDREVEHRKRIRALAVDQIVEAVDLERPCRHKKCDFVATIGDGLRSHEMACDRRMVPCPCHVACRYSPIRLMVQIGCCLLVQDLVSPIFVLYN